MFVSDNPFLSSSMFVVKIMSLPKKEALLELASAKLTNIITRTNALAYCEHQDIKATESFMLLTAVDSGLY